MKTRYCTTAAFAAVLSSFTFSLSGCGDSIGLVPVSGIVTINGEPFPGASISFTPSASNDPATSGIDATGPEGNYRIMYRGKTGLAPGKYSVLVSKEYSPSAATEAFEMVDADGNVIDDDPYMAEVGSMTAGDPLGGQSGGAGQITKVSETFEAEVEPGGSNLDFDVKATAEEAKILRSN